MGKVVDSLIFRRLTYADFRHINKKGGEEKGGGGQSYIDFPVKSISIDDWTVFLGESTSTGKSNRPIWDIEINSLGINKKQNLRIYQRRLNSVSISSQKIHSRKANRVLSWHPNNSFPINYDSDISELVVYIVKTASHEYWAGWFLKNYISKNWQISLPLQRMFEEEAGYVKFNTKLFVDTTTQGWGFYFDANTIKKLRAIKEEEEVLLDQDISPKLSAIDSKSNVGVKKRVAKIRSRNKKLVENLKKLYKGHCQISGTSYTFRKKNGQWYSEVHHLIPLGEDGSDSYANAIVVSPLIHKMLHYANVSPIDLTKINKNTLPIKINGKVFKITWHPEHLKTVMDALED